MKSHVTIGVLLFTLVVWSLSSLAGESAEVSIANMAFAPQHIKIRAGTTVTWINREKRNNHSIFFQEEGLPESDRLFPGESWQRTFDRPGRYTYMCGPHPEMRGTVEVEP